MLVCLVEPKCRAPVLDDENDFPFGDDGVEESGEVASMLYESIFDLGLVRGAHADQVGSDATVIGGQVRNDVSVEIGGSGISVDDDDCWFGGLVALRRRPSVHIGHL